MVDSVTFLSPECTVFRGAHRPTDILKFHSTQMTASDVVPAMTFAALEQDNKERELSEESSRFMEKGKKILADRRLWSHPGGMWRRIRALKCEGLIGVIELVKSLAVLSQSLTNRQTLRWYSRIAGKLEETL
jgi:hypothetical protein